MSSNSFIWVTEGGYLSTADWGAALACVSVSPGCTRWLCGRRLWSVTKSALEACTRWCAIQI